MNLRKASLQLAVIAMITLTPFVLTKSGKSKAPVPVEQATITPTDQTDQIVSRGQTYDIPIQQTDEPPQQIPKDIIGEAQQIIENLQPDIDEATARTYAQIADDNSNAFGIGMYWILAIIYQESKFKNISQSDAGAVGLMQVMPNTARAMGTNPNELSNPIVNIKTGTKYLSYLLNELGNLRLAIIAYNQGEGNVARGTYQTWYYESVSNNYQLLISQSGG